MLNCFHRHAAGRTAGGRPKQPFARAAGGGCNIYLSLSRVDGDRGVMCAYHATAAAMTMGRPQGGRIRTNQSKKCLVPGVLLLVEKLLSLLRHHERARNQKARLSGLREFGLSGNIQDSDEDRRREEGRHALPMSNQRNGGRTISCSPRCADLDSRNQGNKRSERAGCVVFIILLFLSKEGGVVS